MFGSNALSFKLFLKAFEGDFKGGTFLKKFPLFYSILFYYQSQRSASEVAIYLST